MSVPREGGCACGAVRYRLTSDPLFTHCCHCLNCQRQTGSAAFEVYYDMKALWPAASVERLEAIIAPASSDA